ncbi:MAG: 2-oxoglutarate dehydrogenase complex dihydrolipoyllysine-residue succinyltransferase [Vicinamibacterales bacterium]
MSLEIVVPQLGESVVEARVARWLKKAGDRVNAGEPLVELETEKIDLEVGSERAGVLTEVRRREGEDVKVGEVLAVVNPSDVGANSPATPAPSPVGTPVASAAPADERATPTARKMAAEHAIDLSVIAGTGERGRVTKKDVEDHVARANVTAPVGPAAPPSAGPATRATRPAPPVSGERREERVRMSKRRLTIARNLLEAQQTAAMLTTFNEVDMSAVMSLRERFKEDFKKRHDISLGISSFFVKACIGALKAFPRLNAEIQGEEMVLKQYYDIGIAVGAAQGLVVPVLRDAERMSFADIEGSIRDFAKRAAEGTLSLEDLRGGTFTITNGGIFGSLLSTPILNPPQVGILGLHKIEDRPVAVHGQVAIRPMMYVALTYDHRIVDGLEAVQFLVRLKSFIEDPGYMLIES